ncbi:hypothetical protein K0M31_010719 [Melipona bicolor]|uniref:Uncharacterized protein n=1 Tax=Melipona bicolor TaxID=60889 RepID=A0AA40FKS0_9HYME|nr:hypothetical protein K0M31_010719 [Melipona bicolor]
MAENKRSFRKQKARLQLPAEISKKDVQNQILGMPSSDFNSDFALLTRARVLPTLTVLHVWLMKEPNVKNAT